MRHIAPSLQLSCSSRQFLLMDFCIGKKRRPSRKENRRPHDTQCHNSRSCARRAKIFTTQWSAWQITISRRTMCGRQRRTSSFIPARRAPSCSRRTQRLPACVARRAVQCETVMKKRGDIRFAKACQFEVPIQRGPTECLLIIGRFLWPHVFPFGLVQHGNVHLAAPAIQQLHHAPDRL